MWKLNIALVFAIVISPYAIAQDEIKVQGYTFEGDIKEAKMKPGIEVKPHPGKAQVLVPHKLRDSYFEKADLLKDLAGLDDLDKDIFFHKSQKLSLNELLKAYPHLNSKKLQKLKSLL